MNRLATRTLAVAIMLSTVLSSRAATGPANDPSFQRPVHQAVPTAPTVLSRKVALNPTELARYQQKSEQSLALATHEAAGGKNRTTVIVVAAVVVVAAAVALVVHNVHSLNINPSVQNH